MTEVSLLEQKYETAVDQDAIATLLSRAVGDLGFSLYSYLTCWIPGRPISETAPIFLTNYPNEWRTRYLWRNYHLNDPVSVLGRKSRLPFVWGGDEFLKRFGSNQRIVFHEARAFGVARGFTVPVHGPGGECGLFTVASNDTDIQFKEALLACGGELQLLGVQAHSLCMERLGEADRADNLTLTARERECLIWTARGKTSEEIACIINRSTPTVNYHLQKAMRKLDTVNKFQAVIKAYERNLLI